MNPSYRGGPYQQQPSTAQKIQAAGFGGMGCGCLIIIVGMLVTMFVGCAGLFLVFL